LFTKVNEQQLPTRRKRKTPRRPGLKVVVTVEEISANNNYQREEEKHRIFLRSSPFFFFSLTGCSSTDSGLDWKEEEIRIFPETAIFSSFKECW
jgi:hypothetical protein